MATTTTLIVLERHRLAAGRQPQSCTQQRADRPGRHLRLQRLGGRADENRSILQHWKDTTWE
jgi:hypothetical protein